MNLLIVAPHSDDEVLGCGGIISKFASEGNTVFVAIMTSGSVGAPELFSKEGTIKVRQDAKKAHESLGVKDTFFFEYPAPRLETIPAYKIANDLLDLYKKLEIERIYLPHRGDMHKDHAIVFYAGLVAARPINSCPVKEVYTYETLSETEWAAPFGSDVFIPNVFEDITDHLDKKKKAMAFFETQLKKFPHPRSLDSIEDLARHRGATVGYRAAEAFALIRSIR